MDENLAILVAEDDDNDAELLKMALSRAGINGSVWFVKNGREAIDYLQGRGKYVDRSQYPFPKIVITDLKMPGLNGLELLEWLRSHPDCKVLPTILMSGSGLHSDVKRAYQFGVNSYFQKPSTLAELIDLMRLLKEYWMRNELPPSQQKCA